MPGIGVGIGIGLDPSAAGGGGGGGAAAFIPTFSYFEQATAIYVESGVAHGPFKWDKSGTNIDPDGMLETTNYTNFTMPCAGILGIQMTFAYNKSSILDSMSHRIYLKDESDVNIAPFLKHQMAFTTAYYNQGSSGGSNIFEVASGQQIRIWAQPGVGWGNTYTNGKTRCKLTLWKPV